MADALKEDLMKILRYIRTQELPKEKLIEIDKAIKTLTRTKLEDTDANVAKVNHFLTHLVEDRIPELKDTYLRPEPKSGQKR